MGNDLQSGPASFAGADHHARVQLASSTFTSRLSTPALQLIDRSFDHGSVRKEGVNESLEIVGQMEKGLSEATEPLSIGPRLYAHILLAYRFEHKSQEKNESSKNFFQQRRRRTLGVVQIPIYSVVKTHREKLPRTASLLSESQARICLGPIPDRRSLLSLLIGLSINPFKRS